MAKDALCELAMSDAATKEATRLRVAILVAERESRWADAAKYRDELEQVNALMRRREYRA